MFSWEIYKFFRSSYRRCFIKKAVLKNFTIFTEKLQTPTQELFLWILNTDRIQWTFSSKDSFVEFQNSYFPTFLSILAGHSEKCDRNAPTFLITFIQPLCRVWCWAAVLQRWSFVKMNFNTGKDVKHVWCFCPLHCILLTPCIP